MLEEKDEVKMMNHMIHYAQCMVVRDKQVGCAQHSTSSLTVWPVWAAGCAS